MSHRPALYGFMILFVMLFTLQFAVAAQKTNILVMARPQTQQQAFDLKVFTNHPVARWVRHEDYDLSDTLSLHSLMLGSSLFSTVTYAGRLASLPDGSGPFRTDFERLQVIDILHAAGADRDLRVGDTVIAADMLGKDGSEFLDDLPVNAPGKYFVFLQRLREGVVLSGTIYDRTSFLRTSLVAGTLIAMGHLVR